VEKAVAAETRPEVQHPPLRHEMRRTRRGLARPF
jgi:hypothetical protein